MPDKVKELFEMVSEDGYFKDENELRTYLKTPKEYAEVYEMVAPKGYFKDQKEFDSYFTEKKNGTPNGGTPSKTGTKSTSPSKSKSTLTKYEPIQGIEKAPVKEFKPLVPQETQPIKTAPVEMGTAPMAEDPTKQLLAAQWGRKPMSKEIVQMGKEQAALGAEPLSEKEYSSEYSDARLVLDKLPSRVKAVIKENNRDEILDYLKDNPYEMQRMARWVKDPTKTDLQSEQIVLDVLKKAVGGTVQKDAYAMEQMDNLYGTGEKLKRLNTLTTDLDKTTDELKKYQTQVEFYQNQYLNSKGNADLVSQIKATKTAMNGFDYNSFEKQVGEIKKQIEPIGEELEQFTAQYPNGIPQELYPKYQELYREYQAGQAAYNDLINNPEYLNYQKNIETYNGLIGKQQQLIGGLTADANYKKALEGYESTRAKYDTLRGEYDEMTKDDIQEYLTHARKVAKGQDVLNSIEPAFPIVVERAKVQEAANKLREYLPSIARATKGGSSWETIPEAVEKVAGGALELMSKIGKATGGIDEKGAYTMTDQLAEYLNDFGKINNTVVYESGLTDKKGDINWSDLPIESLRQVGNLAVFATVGRFTGGSGVQGMVGSTVAKNSPMVATAYFMSRGDRNKEAEQAGLKGTEKEMYVSTLSLLEGLSELIMPDNQLFTKPVRNKLLAEAVEGVAKGKNWYTKQALATIVENGGKEGAEELVVKLGELLEKTAINYANGNVFDVEEYKNYKEWVATALVAAPLAGVSTAIGQIDQPTKQMNADLYRAATNMTASREVLDVMVDKGKLTAEQADRVYKKVVGYAALKDIIPQDISPEKAVELAPIIEENETIKMLLKDADDIFKPRLQEALKQNIEKAQEILNRQDESTRPIEPTVEGVTESVTAADTGSKEGVQEADVQVGQESIGIKRIIQPSKPVSEMNSEEMYEFAKETRKALKAQDKEFENRTEEEKEAAGYNDIVDEVEDLRDAAERINFVENAEDINDLANSVKSTLSNIKGKEPNEYQLAILNSAKNKAAELGIDVNDLIKEISSKIANQFKDIEDAELMVKSALQKIIPKAESTNKPVPTPEIPLSEQKRENKQVEEGLNEQGVGVAQKVIDNATYTPRHKNGTIVRLPIDLVLENQDPDYAVERGKNEIGSRVDKAKKYLESNPKELEASDIYIKDTGRYKGKVGFADGRHRLIAAKEMGATHAYFELPETKEQFDALNYLLSEFGNESGKSYDELTSTQGDYRIIQTSDNRFLVNSGSDIYAVNLDESGGFDNANYTKNGKKIKLDYQLILAIQNHLQNVNPESNARNINKFIGRDENAPIPTLNKVSKKEQKKIDDDLEQSIKETPKAEQPQSETVKQEIKDETEKEITTSEVAPETGLQQRLGETGEELTTPAAELNKPEKVVVETEAVAEPAKTGELTPEAKENLQSIEAETGVNFREVQNVYTKYGEGKPLSEITKADFEKAQEKREKANEVKGGSGDADAAAKKIVGESAFDKLKKEGYTIVKGKFDSDAYASFFGLHTGVQAAEFENAGLRLVKPSEKIKVYRGKGKNVGEGENEGITWVAEDKKVAENYSSDGKVEEVEVSKPKNPFPNPTDTIHVKGSDVGNKLKGILNRLFREGKVTKEQAIEASKAIDEFVSAAGEESELYSTKTNKKGVSSKYVKALQSLGFDGIIQKESYNSGSPFTATKTGNETNTYGIFKEVKQSKEAQKAKAEKTIDEAANWLKEKLRVDLPEGTKKSGFGQDELIDLVANAVKALVNTGIEVSAAVKQVMDSLREGGYLEDFDEATISKKAQAKAVQETKKEKVEAQKELLGLYETLSENPTTNAEFGKTLEANPLAYQVIPNKETRNEAVEYVKEVGFAQALDNVLKGKIPNGRLNTAVSYYLYSAMQTELVKAIEEGNTALADEILQVKLDLVGKVGERLKNAGQEIQAAVFFAQDLTDPIAANFHYERAVQKANEEMKERKKGEAEREVRKAKRVAEQGEKEFEAAVQEKFNTEKPKRSSLSPKKQQRKAELRNKIMGKLRDVTTAAAELLDPEFYEYGALIIEDGYKDFQSFSKKVIQETGGKLKKVLVNLYKGSAQRAIDDGIMSESEITTDKEISKFLTDKLTDKQIDKLIRENLGTKLAEIAKEYYKQGEELKTPQGLAEKIIEVLKEEIPLTKEDALRMAKWIDGRYSTLVKERVSKALEQQVKARITQEGKSKTEEPATVPFADKLANGLLNGTLTADQFIDYFGAFYGLTTYTAADTKFVTDMVNKIKATDLDFRKNEYTYAVMKHMVDKHPVEILDALNAAWYGAVLSGIGTQDVNITFGLDALQFSFFEQLADTVAETFAAKGNKERIKTAWSTFFTGLAKVMNDGKPDNSDSNVKKVWNAIRGFGSGARNAAAYAYTKGVSSFEDNASQLEFESRKDIDFTKISENLKAGNWLSRTKKNLATFAAKKYFNNLKYFSSRSLAAADLFFNNLIWRQEIAPVMERYYRETTNPDGTKRTEKQIRAEMQKLFFATEEQYEEIQDKAAAERMKFDFEFEQNAEGKWEILDNGKKDKQTFDTKAEAVEYAEDNLARKGLVYQRSVIELLNQRIPKEQMQIAKAMAADAIGTGETKGTAGVVYNMINYLKVLIDRKARDKGKTVQTAAFIVNKMILPAFVKFPLNFVNMTTNYSPLGFLRAYSKNGTILPVGSKFARDMDNEYQRQRMVYKAAYGTVLLAAGLIKYLDFGDDDEETDKKREERYNDYLKMGGDPTINIENAMFDLPKDGDVIGSLAFLPPKKKEFLIQSGLAQEYSQYDAKKNRWISFIADRAAVSKQIAGTVNAYMRFVWSDPTLSTKGELDAKKAASVFGSIVSATIDQYLQLSSLKGTQRLLSAPSYSQGATGKVSDIAVTAATTPLQIFQPALTRQLSQYIDGKMREYPSITKMDEADYGILLAKQNLIPFGSVFFKGDVRYDQFGDPMISVPAEKQGMLSSNYSAAMFDKYPNRKLQLFLYENGVFEYKQPPMTMYYYPEGENVEGRPQYEFLTHKEIKEVGLQAAKYYKEILTANMSKAQEVANAEWKDKFDINKPTFETKFSKYIDKLYELSLDRAFEEFVATKNGVVSEEKTKQAKRKPQSTSESDKQYRKRIRYKTAEEKYLKEIEE